VDVLGPLGRVRGLLATLLALLVSACFLFSSQDPGKPRFSHAIHVGKKHLECIECHGMVYSKEGAGMPNPEVCSRCHDIPDQKKPPEDRIAARFDEAGRYMTRPVASIPDEVSFSHRFHVYKKEIECSDCHGDVAGSDTIPAESAVTKDQCMTCHSHAGKENKCAECHTKIDQQWAPETHRHAWEKRHGEVVRSRAGATIHRCSLCHNEPAGCDACHQQREPRSHTNYWRQRGHSVMVSLDRRRCATCHRSDFCNRCHQYTRPRSHRGGFGSPQNRHCVTCHLPLKGEGCFTCHKGTPSHGPATPMPPGHLPSMNCRQCHGLGAPLPHPDPGVECTACHR